MRSVSWSPDAEAALEAYIDWLTERNPLAAARATADFEALTVWLGKRTMPGRPSRWDGLRIKSVTDWSKIVVFQVTDTHIRIVGFYDTWQDDRVLSFEPE